MATLASVITSLESSLSSELSLTTQVASAYRTDLEDIAAGATKYQIQPQHEAPVQADSNVQIDGASIEVVIHHRLADPTDEEAYTRAAMQTQQVALVSRQWWRDNVTGIRSVNGAENSADVTRDGNVVSWSVVVSIDISPS